MKIERYQPGKRQTSPLFIACGCMGIIGIGILIVVISAIIILPALPGMVLSNFGIEERGSTDEILNNMPIATIPALMDVQTIGSVTLNTGTYSQTLASSGTSYTVIMGDTEDTMQMQMQVSLSEEGMLIQCRELTTICSASSEGIRNASFDLRSGGVIINAEFEIATGQWQEAGLVVQLGMNNRLEIVGVDIAGRVYAPMNTEFANLVNEAETRANLFLEQLNARAGINEFNLSDIVIEDTRITLIMR